MTPAEWKLYSEACLRSERHGRAALADLSCAKLYRGRWLLTEPEKAPGLLLPNPVRDLYRRTGFQLARAGLGTEVLAARGQAQANWKAFPRDLVAELERHEPTPHLEQRIALMLQLMVPNRAFMELTWLRPTVQRAMSQLLVEHPALMSADIVYGYFTASTSGNKAALPHAMVTLGIALPSEHDGIDVERLRAFGRHPLVGTALTTDTPQNCRPGGSRARMPCSHVIETALHEEMSLSFLTSLLSLHRLCGMDDGAKALVPDTSIPEADLFAQMLGMSLHLAWAEPLSYLPARQGPQGDSPPATFLRELSMTGLASRDGVMRRAQLDLPLLAYPQQLGAKFEALVQTLEYLQLPDLGDSPAIGEYIARGLLPFTERSGPTEVHDVSVDVALQLLDRLSGMGVGHDLLEQLVTGHEVQAGGWTSALQILRTRQQMQDTLDRTTQASSAPAERSQRRLVL